MSLGLLKEDLQALVYVVLGFIIWVTVPPSNIYVRVAVTFLGSPVVFLTFLVSAFYYPLRKRARLKRILKFGWDVRGNKIVPVAVVFVLLLVPALYSPSNLTLSDDAPAIGNESPFDMFSVAGDGDESSESITTFSETLPDDTLFYPDLFRNDTAITASSGDFFEWETNTYTETLVLDGTDWNVKDVNSPYTPWFSLNFTLPTNLEIQAIEVNVYGRVFTEISSEKLAVYNWSSNSWVDTANWFTVTDSWLNSTHYDPDMWGTQVAIRLDYIGTNIYIDYAEVICHVMHLGDSDHYAESFADVSDWSYVAGGAVGSTSITTDGDVVTFSATFTGSGWAEFNTAFSSDASMVYEWRVRNVNASDGYCGVRVGTSGAQDYDSFASTSWVTLKKQITGDRTTVRIALSGGAANTYQVQGDYVRVGETDEMGFSHDGSTTSGLTDDSSVDWTYSKSSDGDILTLTFNRTATGASDSFGEIRIPFDTTATAHDVELSYYPFFEMKWRVTAISGGQAIIYYYTDGKTAVSASETITSGYITTTTDWRTDRFNALAMTGSSSNKYISFFCKGISLYHSMTVEMDYTKAYSIANFTVTQSGVTTDDYLYVSGGILYSHVSSGTIEANHDPALSITDTYPVYNLTTSGTAPEFSQYVSSWSTYSDDTRGATTSGTVTDIKLKFDSNEILSAIKFIEDSTKPDIIRANMAPTDPSEDEEITLSAVATDSVEIYRLWFDAITYPTGFSDVEYDATEISDNLWTYSFSSMTQGYYVFKVLATDGANENDLDYYSYIEFTVRESEITIDEISFFGVGADFTMMTFSFKINKDCTYVINEASANIGASDTHSGSVSEGTVNMAWDKLTTTDDIVNFTITFTNGTDTKTMDGQYQVAQTILSVSAYDWALSETQVVLSYQTTKAGTYTFYRDDVQISTDSFISGSNVLNWSRPSSTDPSVIRAAVRLTDGTDTVWLNQTYDEYSVSTLSILVFIFEKDYPNISIFVNTNWGNCTLYVYENDVLMDSGVEGTLSYEKCTNLCTSRVGVKADGGGSIIWGNFTYTGVPENLTITAISFNTFGEYITAFATTNWLNCTLSLSERDNGGGSYVLMSEEPEGETVRYLKSTTPGNYMVKFRIEGGTDEKNMEFSYTVAVTYGTSTINAFLPSGEGIIDLPSKFKLYVNGSRIGDNSFYNDTSASYEICVKDYYDNEIYNTTHSWASNIDLSLVFHTLKIYSQIQNDPIYFVLTRGGSTISEYIGIGEILRYYLASGTYSYSFTQGGQVYTGNLILTDDSYYTVTDLDLWDIMNKPINAGGGTDIYSILSWYGIVGLFGLLFIGQIPNISKFIWSLFSRPKKPKKRMG